MRQQKKSPEKTRVWFDTMFPNKTRYEIAKKIGLTPGTFRSYLSRNKFPISVINNLAKILDINVDEVCKYVDVARPRKNTEVSSSATINLLPIMRTLSNMKEDESLNMEEFKYLLSVPGSSNFSLVVVQELLLGFRSH